VGVIGGVSGNCIFGIGLWLGSFSGAKVLAGRTVDVELRVADIWLPERADEDQCESGKTTLSFGCGYLFFDLLAL